MTRPLRSVDYSDGQFADMVNQQAPRLYRYILKHIGHSADAEDLTQQTFLEAYRALPSFRGDSKLETWLFGIALNLVRNYRNRSPQRRYQFLSDHILALVAGPDTSPEELAVQRDLLRQLEVALGQMSPELREVLVHVAMEGRPYEEAAVLLNIPIGTIRSRLSRARAFLQRHLEACTA
jgi:RNA polymerase sigma factor (sigma-70 family)